MSTQNDETSYQSCSQDPETTVQLYRQESTMKDSLTNNSEDLQGETLVPNSPLLSLQLDSISDYRINNKMATNFARNNPMACVFVANLERSFKEEELSVSVRDHFVKWGEISNINVFIDFKNRPFAFVQYNKASDAQRAVKEGMGSLLDGRIIRCEPAKVNRTLNIFSSTFLDEKTITDALSCYGEIEKVQMFYKDLCTSSYVKFRYRGDAINALLMSQSLTLERQWKIEWVANINPGTTHDDRLSCSIYIGNLDINALSADIYEKFSNYGTIININVIKRRRVRFKTTFGFVKYTTDTAAELAIAEEHGQTWHGHIMKVALARPQKSDGPGRFIVHQNTATNNYKPYYYPPSYILVLPFPIQGDTAGHTDCTSPSASPKDKFNQGSNSDSNQILVRSDLVSTDDSIQPFYCDYLSQWMEVTQNQQIHLDQCYWLEQSLPMAYYYSSQQLCPYDGTFYSMPSFGNLVPVIMPSYAPRSGSNQRTGSVCDMTSDDEQ